MRTLSLSSAAALALFFLAGCASLLSSADQPESLEPFQVPAPVEAVYDEALALGFDRGYHIAYAVEDEGLLEMERLDRRFPYPAKVRRLDLLVRRVQGETVVHARYHSFDPDDPADIEVADEDREAAQAFVEALQKRLSGYARRAPERP